MCPDILSASIFLVSWVPQRKNKTYLQGGQESRKAFWLEPAHVGRPSLSPLRCFADIISIDSWGCRPRLPAAAATRLKTARRQSPIQVPCRGSDAQRRTTLAMTRASAELGARIAERDMGDLVACRTDRVHRT
jgi:hypothetical protein